MRRCVPLFGLLLSGCLSQMAIMPDSVRSERDLAFDELRIELGDLRHATQAQKVEIQLLQERLRDQEAALDSTNKNRTRSDTLTGQLAAVEKKVLLVEKQQERLLSDLRLLSKHYEQSGSGLNTLQDKITSLQSQLEQHASRLNDIQQLKATLSQVSRAISEKSTSPAESKHYRVKAGDSLEKIARQNNLSVQKLKKINNLSTDRIFSGQELLISADES